MCWVSVASVFVVVLGGVVEVVGSNFVSRISLVANSIGTARFFMFFTLIFGDNFFFLLILANCSLDESCKEELAPISPRGPKFVTQT